MAKDVYQYNVDFLKENGVRTRPSGDTHFMGENNDVKVVIDEYGYAYIRDKKTRVERGVHIFTQILEPSDLVFDEDKIKDCGFDKKKVISIEEMIEGGDVVRIGDVVSFDNLETDMEKYMTCEEMKAAPKMTDAEFDKWFSETLSTVLKEK